ncbi:formate dehydrogenase accessory protein FdhE [Gallibacterium anatis]|uniref:Protein FdhE homolog n=1 Tax=Gallibacterium anatis TaxID=750 RepID=A0AAX3X9A1_9PAST|nr:formate dehydrogenase accessory protein FdhE [Gallibacterium anatis]KGQ46667.1 formate dehydrogenase [Gallibacterium anatis]KGQ65936.1 formate dehydrogenase [Gallibacterium anatis 7990]MDK9431328.1 formate dehydrogenase accessory protein FdhE [Gallibacterium anatis]WIM78778.1 formate dehydrogenase accessory protein FdhE [Gallibacterium anatis]
MSIRILPESEIKQAAEGLNSPPLLFANPKNLYQRRAKRLRQLAENSPFKDYLQFTAKIVDVQLRLLQEQPIAKDPRLDKEVLSAEVLASQPLHFKNWKRDAVWQTLLTHLLEECKSFADGIIADTIETLEKMSMQQREQIADHLLNSEFEAVSSDQAIFVWAALNLYWVQLVQQIPHHANAELGEHRHFCPVCGSAPITSVVHFGTTQGLRYVHCALCESEWNIVRSKCTNCEQTAHIDYWSLDSEYAAVKAESCDDCHSYLKVLYQDKDPNVEPAADDLATLLLDNEMEEKGYARSGINPLLFPVG